MLDVVDRFVNKRINGESHLEIAKSKNVATIRTPSSIEKSNDRVLNLAMPVFIIDSSCLHGVSLAHTDYNILAIGRELIVSNLVRETINGYIIELDCVFDLNNKGKTLKILR